MRATSPKTDVAVLLTISNCSQGARAIPGNRVRSDPRGGLGLGSFPRRTGRRSICMNSSFGAVHARELRERGSVQMSRRAAVLARHRRSSTALENLLLPRSCAPTISFCVAGGLRQLTGARAIVDDSCPELPHRGRTRARSRNAVDAADRGISPACRHPWEESRIPRCRKVHQTEPSRRCDRSMEETGAVRGFRKRGPIASRASLGSTLRPSAASQTPARRSLPSGIPSPGETPPHGRRGHPAFKE